MLLHSHCIAAHNRSPSEVDVSLICTRSYVGTAAGYWLDYRGSQFPAWQDFALFSSVSRLTIGAHRASFATDTGSSFPGRKAADA
jgi:hypothetical protein